MQLNCVFVISEWAVLSHAIKSYLLFGKLVIYKTVVTAVGCFCFTHLLFSFLCQMVKAVARIAEHPACFEAFPPKAVVELCLPKIHHQGFKSKQRTLLDRRLRFVCFLDCLYF